MGHRFSSHGDPDRWLMCFKRQPQARLRVFCFPYAGGGASAFRSWPEALPAGVELIAIQPPGREGRRAEPPYTRVGPLVDGIVRALCWNLDRPFVFFGHSVGSIVAFETVRALRRAYGVSPAHLVVSARRPPQVPSESPPVFDRPRAAFIGELQRLNGTPDEVLRNAEMLELFLPLLRADFELDETYEYRAEARLACPITVFGGTADPCVDPSLLEGWCGETQGGCDVRLFAGDHFFLDGARAAVLRALSPLLDRVMAPGGDAGVQAGHRQYGCSDVN